MSKTLDSTFKVKLGLLPSDRIITVSSSSTAIHPNMLKKVFLKRGQNVIGLYPNTAIASTSHTIPLIVRHMLVVYFYYLSSTISKGLLSFTIALLARLLARLSMINSLLRVFPEEKLLMFLNLILRAIPTPLNLLSGVWRISISENCLTTFYSILQAESFCICRIVTSPQGGRLKESIERYINSPLSHRLFLSSWKTILRYFLNPRYIWLYKVILRYTVYIRYQKITSWLVSALILFTLTTALTCIITG